MFFQEQKRRTDHKQKRYLLCVPGCLSLCESPGVGVTFPDFPGCVSHGKNEITPITIAQEALALHIFSMLEDGEPFTKTYFNAGSPTG
ncbi:type II toxin-antitoxin system HicB family antitoxin [Melghirimyces algeriensis]|uniref:type II toxin-antitoxin system HicB family antitoxin n=1 Tax=Melghirimyces algeriensis TaxID=910412 RepID=UPI0011590892